MTGKKTPPQRIVWPSWFRALGSVWCAAFLLATLAIILIASTTLESKLGTPRAQRLVYQTRWFDAFLALLGINIFVSTILRWPFKKKHTGFIITHIGILLLLTGSLMTRLGGVEGQMLLYEAEHSNHIAANSLEVLVTRGPNSHDAYPLEFMKTGKSFGTLPDGTRLIYKGFRENAVLETSVEDGAAAPNPAIRVRISSELAGFGESFWLVADDPSDRSSASKSLGPAAIELHAGEPPAEAPTAAAETADPSPRLIFHKDSEVLASIPIDPLPAEPVAVGKTGYRLQKIQYWPDARVGENNKLVSISAEHNNPAVEAELVSPDGGIIRLVRFTFFPDFESLHSKPGEKRPDFDVELKAGMPKPQKPAMPTLAFYAGNEWRFLFRSTKGARADGVIEEGKTYPAGWMDFQFTVERLVRNAQVRRVVKDVSGKKGGPAVWIALEKDGRSAGDGWLTGEARLIGPDGAPLPILLRQRMIAVPFTLLLKDFRKVDYPGTNRAASFESDVTLDAPAEGFSLTKTIKMNKPLDYGGYRIFQSSYIEDQGHGEASVFTVAKNPGIPLIYGGSIILFLGVFVTFFMPPFSSLMMFKN